MSSLYVNLEPKWEKLMKQFATRHISRVELSVSHDGNQVELSCEYFSCWMRFSDTCGSLRRKAPRPLWEKFHAVFRPVLDRMQEVDLEPARNCLCEGRIPSKFEYTQYFWENIFMILTPETCLKVAEDSQAVCLADYWPYFQPNLNAHSYFEDFKEFEGYAQSWIACFRKAAWEKAGIVVVCLE